MNYLVIEGYKDAAEKFQLESGASRKLFSSLTSYQTNSFKAGLDLDTIAERMKVRQAIQKGDIQGGIERVNDLDPSVREASLS
jgi:glucose-induced degradation protein 8